MINVKAATNYFRRKQLNQVKTLQPSEPIIKLIRRPERRYLAGLFYVYAVSAAFYLPWRIMVTNWDAWLGPPTLALEIFGIITTTLALLVLRGVYEPERRLTLAQRDIDVFITTYNEPLDILKPTLKAALAIRGARRVLVLDDGNRTSVRRLCKRLGADFYGRRTNLHAKAGNLNNGLAHSTAEFVITLDVDHIPRPDFVERTLAYFEDPRLAFVQTPQTYYNRSSFLFRRHRRDQGYWSEQQMFYDVIQVAKNRWNSSFFVGTSAMLRRRALDDVGGFATGTATEDIHTSLRLHARGWRSLFLPEVLAEGLEASSLREFYKQRRRWAAGSLGLLFRSPDSPLRARGLTFMQRLNYLSATLAHLQGLQKLLFFLVPPLVLFSLVNPVTLSYSGFGLIFLGYLLAAVGITARYARGTYHPFYTEAYALANSLAHLSGLWGIFKVQKKFAVSRKIVRPNERSWQKVILWALAAVSMAAMAIGIMRLIGVLDGRSHQLVITALLFNGLNIIWLGGFLGVLFRYEHGGATPVAPKALRATGQFIPEQEPQPSLGSAWRRSPEPALPPK